nr:PREDICTED: placenta-specific protein 9 isoform X2 [Anolis carolinensis]|eukprot:XP_016852955.1 PREDICTED: placenta-specific protein 9 isoform X2 [Anolis carolinensis]
MTAHFRGPPTKMEAIFFYLSPVPHPKMDFLKQCMTSVLGREAAYFSASAEPGETPSKGNFETMHYIWPLFFIFMLNTPGRLVAADPVIDHHTSSEQSDWCDNHNTIHRRLDTVQEVEKTVDQLDTEVNSILNTISKTEQSIPLAPGTPLMDLYEDPS